ncbi:polyhydroxyalkanoate synthesis repressor PhaR [Algicella marina]|uniref:Polyhydroxyalkanoate synthesis repressor PhaR n=1 Tax=Algicella marina TaxID=2683284 RepID=A0A6P1T5R1_9RHOB|nr:polyhydroxyalkanoate synthesis repressor PhaR [Algicella marina]QHQ37033.1 polyhydroxyalkanoate synthesis repressor PhaR [Algicella marina]
MARAKQEEGDEIVIKKYANRRLYNTKKSSYVTLEDLAQMVRDGDDFIVRDAKSGEDITRSVLTQIIFEEEAKGQTMLPANFLRQLIRLYGDTLQGVVPGYLEASMESFSRNQEQIREQMARTFGAAPAMNNLEAMTRANMEIYQNAIRMFSPFTATGTGPGPEGAEKPAKPEESTTELDELKSQLTKMQDQLSRLVKDT